MIKASPPMEIFGGLVSFWTGFFGNERRGRSGEFTSLGRGFAGSLARNGTGVQRSGLFRQIAESRVFALDAG